MDKVNEGREGEIVTKLTEDQKRILYEKSVAKLMEQGFTREEAEGQLEKYIDHV